MNIRLYFKRLVVWLKAFKSIVLRPEDTYMFLIVLRNEAKNIIDRMVNEDPFFYSRKKIKTEEELRNEAFLWVLNFGMNTAERLLEEDEECVGYG